MSGVKVELRNLSPVAFPNASHFTVLDDDTVVIRAQDGTEVGAVHRDAWVYVWLDGVAS